VLLDSVIPVIGQSCSGHATEHQRASACAWALWISSPSRCRSHSLGVMLGARRAVQRRLGRPAARDAFRTTRALRGEPFRVRHLQRTGQGRDRHRVDASATGLRAQSARLAQRDVSAALRRGDHTMIPISGASLDFIALVSCAHGRLTGPLCVFSTWRTPKRNDAELLALGP